MAVAHTHTISSAEATPVQIGAKFIRWGLGLFVFGLATGYGPWLHYMHGALEEVHEAFLKNVTLWFGCPWTLPVYVTQLGGLGMVAFGLCYIAFARDGAMASVTNSDRIAPTLCALGIITEFVFGFPLYFAVNAVWPNFYYTPIASGKWTWLGVQGACIAIYVAGTACAYGGIKRASHVLETRGLAVR
jgi:hypothetical protein